MAIIRKINVEKDQLIIVDKIDQTIDFYLENLIFSKKDIEVLDAKTPKKQLEWLALQYSFVKELGWDNMEIIHDENGKPSFLHYPEKHISISHSDDKIAYCISDKACGIDVQYFTDKIAKIKHKFLHEEENRFLKEEILKLQLHIIWSAKEAIYKWYSKRGLSFRYDMKIEPFEIEEDEFMIQGEYYIDGAIVKTTLEVVIIKGAVVVWTS